MITTDINKFGNNTSEIVENQHCHCSSSKSLTTRTQLFSTGKYVSLNLLTCYTWYFLCWKQYNNDMIHHDINTVLAISMRHTHTHAQRWQVLANVYGISPTNVCSYANHQWKSNFAVNCRSAVTVTTTVNKWVLYPLSLSAHKIQSVHYFFGCLMDRCIEMSSFEARPRDSPNEFTPITPEAVAMSR